MSRQLAILMVCLLVAACSGESHQDLRQWMKEQGQSTRGKIDPLPQVKPYEPFAYNAFDLPDPFKPRKIELAKGGGRLQPDLNRRKEPLEAYPLETLQMVGTLQKSKSMYGLIKTTDRNVYQVRVGNYMGQNFGVITAVTENEIRLKELVQDSAGDWSERASSLLLQDTEQKQEQKK